MFDLTIRHKINKANIVSNTFFRLQKSIIITKKGFEILKALYEQAIEIVNKKVIFNDAL